MSNEAGNPLEGVTAAELTMAGLVAEKIDNLLREITATASALGTSVTSPQLLSGILAATWSTTERPMTRDEFASIYDYVERLQGIFAQSFTFGHSHETVSSRITDVALDIPGSLGEFPEENIGG
jgi:hypothetical protein